MLFGSHNMCWEEYCLKYNHIPEEKNYFSIEHRNKLAKRIIERNISTLPHSSYIFQFEDSSGYPSILRSFEEFKIITMLLKNNIKFKYEKHSVNWLDKNGFEHIYIPDLKIGKDFYEIKGVGLKRLEHFNNEEKYKKSKIILKQLNCELFLVNTKILQKKFNLNKSVYNNNFFYKELKTLLDNNKVKIKYRAIKNLQPKLLKIIDENYQNNLNIIKYGE